MISELQRELVGVARFRAALRAWAAQDVRRAAYGRDLGRIYADYAAELERLDRVDAELFAWRAVDALRAAPTAWGSDPVLFYGFDDLDGVQRDAVQTLAGPAGAAVTVSLTYEAGREALAARAETVEALRPVAAEVETLGPQDDHYADGSRAVLHHLERHLFAVGAPRLERPDPLDQGASRAVTLLEAGGERAEAELVASEILALTRAGVPGEEIAVLYRSPAAAPLVARVLDQYGIRVTGSGELALAHTTLGRSLLAALAAPGCLTRRPRGPGRLSAGARACWRDREIADRLDALARRRALTSAAALRAAAADIAAIASRPRPTCRPRWRGSTAGGGGGSATLGGAVSPSGRRRPRRATPEAGAGLCALARELLAAPYRGRAPELCGDEAVDAAALATLVAAVAELSALDPAPTALGAARAAAGAAGRLRSRPRRARRPRGGAAGRPDLGPGAALPDRVRLRTAGRRVPARGPDPAVPVRRAPAGAGERLGPGAASAGGRAGGRAVPVLLGRLPRDRTRLPRLPQLRRGGQPGAAVAVHRRCRRAAVARVAAAPAPAAAVRRRLGPGEAPTERERERGLAAALAPRTGEPPGPARTLGGDALAQVRHTRVVSAGALERYGDCPVRWLVESQLSPRRLAPDEEPLVRGSLIHELLEGLLAELGEAVSERSLPRALEILRATDGSAGWARAGARRRRAAGRPGRRAARRSRAALRRYLEHEAVTSEGWRPVALERRFGFDEAEGSLPPLALGDGPEPVLVRGAIDRIDVDRAGRALGA